MTSIQLDPDATPEEQAAVTRAIVEHWERMGHRGHRYLLDVSIEHDEDRALGLNVTLKPE